MGSEMCIRDSLGRLQSNKRGNHAYCENSKDTIENRLSGVVLIANNSNHNQSSHNKPLHQIEARIIGFSFDIHLLEPCKDCHIRY